MNENMGYKYEYKDGSKQFEHRRIAELKIGRKLRKGEIVHHMDGNKLNNDPDNLVVLSRADHGRIHQLTGAVVVELDNGETVVEPKLTQCESCGIYFHQYDARHYCCDDCRTTSIKEHCLTKQHFTAKGCQITVKVCPVCGKLFETRFTTQKYCSQECSHKTQYRCEHPTKELLSQMVWEMSTVQLAKQFGVSDKAVETWCKRYDIQKPPRGYWRKKETGKL